MVNIRNTLDEKNRKKGLLNEIKVFKVYCCAQFMVKRELILKPGYSFWESMYNNTMGHHECTHNNCWIRDGVHYCLGLEVMWPLIFNQTSMAPSHSYEICGPVKELVNLN